MSKKEVKRKASRPTRTKKKLKVKNGGALLLILLFTLGVLFASYEFLGLKLTIVVALLLFVVYAIGGLLAKVKNKSRRRKLISLFLIFGLTIGIIGLSCFCAFMIYVKGQADPKYENAKLNTIEISRIYDKDGNEFAKIGEENREKVKYAQLPEVLVDAIIATEDARCRWSFYINNASC